MGYADHSGSERRNGNRNPGRSRNPGRNGNFDRRPNGGRDLNRGGSIRTGSVRSSTRSRSVRNSGTGSRSVRNSGAGNGRNTYRNRRRDRRKKYLLLGLCLASWVLIIVCCINLARLKSNLNRLDGMMENRGGLSFVEADGEGVTGASGAADSPENASDGTVRAGTVNIIEGSYADRCGLDSVDRPTQRTSQEVLERLEKLGENNGQIADIFDQSHEYPEKLLEALANNPEMADFVSGWQGLRMTAESGLTEQEMEQAHPLFLQWDPRWGYVKYGDENCIGLAGCGPTCLSMVLYSLTGDASITPDRVAAYSMDNGYYIPGTGTAWLLMEDMPEEYGIRVRQPKAAEEEMKRSLDEGSVIILSMSPGDFTAAGHFIVVYGYDEDGFKVNDPNCVARSRRSWSFSELKNQIKNMWVFSRSVSVDMIY